LANYIKTPASTVGCISEVFASLLMPLHHTVEILMKKVSK